MRRLILLPLLAFALWSCEQLGTQPTSPDEATVDAPALNFAVVDRSRNNGKSLHASGFASDYESPPYNNRGYLVSVYDRKTSSGTAKFISVSAYTWLPDVDCSDVRLLAKNEFGKTWVKKYTDCGLVDVRWERASKYDSSRFDEWTGATDDCSPPEGQYSYHHVGNERRADAIASGTVGLFTIPVRGILLETNQASIVHVTSTYTTCD